MTRSELSDKVAAALKIDKAVVDDVIIQTTREISRSLAQGEPVFIRSFGTYLPKKQAAKTARNITLGTTIKVGERFIPAFKPSKQLRENVIRNCTSIRVIQEQD